MYGGVVQQEAVLALLAKEPAHGYQLRARLQQALGSGGDAMNAGQIYVTLSRLEKAGQVSCERAPGLPDRPDRKVYALTAAGQQRGAEWIAGVSLAGPGPSRTARRPRCCWRAWRSGCRPTWPGWRHASRTGQTRRRMGHERYRRGHLRVAHSEAA